MNIITPHDFEHEYVQTTGEILESEINEIKLKRDKFQKDIGIAKKKDTEESSDKILDLMRQLDEEPNTLLLDCSKHMLDGRAYFDALQGDQEKIQRKIEELSNYNFGYILGFIQSPYFLSLDDLNEKDLKEEYLKYFKLQTSECYLGGIINSILSKSFNNGFFGAMTGKELKIDEDFSKIIRVVQKLVDISKKN